MKYLTFVLCFALSFSLWGAGAVFASPSTLLVADTGGFFGEAGIYQFDFDDADPEGSFRNAKPRRVFSDVNFVTPSDMAIAPEGTPFAGQLFIADAGNLIFPADMGQGTQAPRIIRIDTATGESTVVTEGGNLENAEGIVIAPQGTPFAGHIFVADPRDTIFPPHREGLIVAIDPATGAQTRLRTNAPDMTDPFGIAIGAQGNLFVTDAGSKDNFGAINELVFPANRQLTGTWTQTTLIRGEDGVGLKNPLGIAIAPKSNPFSGDLFISDPADFGAGGAIYRIPADGAREAILFSRDENLIDPLRIVFDNAGNLWVADFHENGGTGKVLWIDGSSGEQLEVFSGPPLVNPLGIAVISSPLTRIEARGKLATSWGRIKSTH